MSVARAKQLIADELSEDGAAFDPASIMLFIGIAQQLIALCRKRGSNTPEMAGMVRQPSPLIQRRFERSLRNKIGPSEYRKRGGKTYARKAYAAAAKAKAAECQSFVRETLSAQ